jgi:hypothetical protein
LMTFLASRSAIPPCAATPATLAAPWAPDLPVASPES